MAVTAPLGEFGRIARFFAPLAAGCPGALGLTDDAALIEVPPGERLVATVDNLVEGVHFLPSDPPDLIARKLLRRNLSDLAAMGAAPDCYLLAMALPARCDDGWVERFAAGLAADQREFGIVLAGGDSTATPGPITLSLTALGRLPAGSELRRSGAKAGDRVFVSGTIGDGALGLLAATGRLAALPYPLQEWLIGRYRLPQPRLGLGQALRGLAHAAADVSDGLVADLGHIAECSGVAAIIEAARVPLSDAAAEAVAEDPALLETVLTGGDDYELVLTLPPGAEAALARRAAALGVPVACIGRIEPGGGVRAVDRDGAAIPLAHPGYRHG